MSRQSNAADKSHIKMPVFSFFSEFSAHCFCTSLKAVMVGLLALSRVVIWVEDRYLPCTELFADTPLVQAALQLPAGS